MKSNIQMNMDDLRKLHKDLETIYWLFSSSDKDGNDCSNNIKFYASNTPEGDYFWEGILSLQETIKKAIAEAYVQDQYQIFQIEVDPK